MIKHTPPSRGRFLAGCAGVALTHLLLVATVRADTLDEMLRGIAAYDDGQSKAGLYAINQTLRTTDRRDAETALVRFLMSDPSPSLAARQFACEKLSLVGAEDSRETLAALQAMLDDPRTFDMALWVLDRMGGVAVDRLLLQKLDDMDGEPGRAALVHSLGRHRCADAEEKISGLLNDDSPLLVSAVLTALGRIGTPSAARTLQTALPQVPEPYVPVALDALLRCAESLGAAGHSRQAQVIYRRLSAPEVAAVARAAALRGMVRNAPDQAGDLMIEALGSDDAQLLNVAVILAQTEGDRRTTKALTECLSQLDADGQIQLLAALGVRGDQTATPAVEKRVQHPEARVRVAALQALGRIGGPQSVTLLARTAAQPSQDEKQAARQSLHTLAGQDIDRTILEQISPAPDLVKAELIRSVAARGIQGAVPILLQTVTDPDVHVRRESHRALMAVAGPEALPALVELMAATTDSSQREDLEQVVARVANKNPTVDARARELLATWDQLTDPDIKASILRVAGKTGDPHALPILRAAAAATQVPVQDAAVRALADWPDASGIDDVWKLAQTTENRTYQVLCQRAYLRMVGQLPEQSDEEMKRRYERIASSFTDAPGKMLLLGTLADQARLPALELASGYLSDPVVQAEAQVAVLKIGRVLSGTYPQEVEQSLKTIQRNPANPALADQAGDLMKHLDRLATYVTCWQVSGPYLGQGDLFESAFTPEQAGGDADWKVMPMGLDEQRPWVIQLSRFLGGQNRAAYLRNRIHSGRERAVRLEIGSDDGVKVWLNGAIVHAHDIVRPLQPDQDQVTVTLLEGWNTLLMKVTQGGGGWEASLRIVDADGHRINGLTYAPME